MKYIHWLLSGILSFVIMIIVFIIDLSPYFFNYGFNKIEMITLGFIIWVLINQLNPWEKSK